MSGGREIVEEFKYAVSSLPAMGEFDSQNDATRERKKHRRRRCRHLTLRLEAAKLFHFFLASPAELELRGSERRAKMLMKRRQRATTVVGETIQTKSKNCCAEKMKPPAQSNSQKPDSAKTTTEF